MVGISRGDEQGGSDSGTDGGRDAVAFVAHYYESMVGECRLVDILAIEQHSANGHVGVGCEQVLKVAIMHTDMGYRSHGGDDGFGVEEIDRVAGSEDMFYSEPMASADDSAEVSGVLDSVEHDIESAGEVGAIEIIDGQAIDRHHRRGRREAREAPNRG